MAPVLVCPDCSTKHPLTSIGERPSFPCEGCGRTLKVPTAAMAVATGSVTGAAPERAAAPAPRTRVIAAADPLPPMPAAPSSSEPSSSEPPARPARDPIPPRWARFLLWIVAIPLAFIVILTFARAAGMLTTNEISDVALAEGWGRFWPIARLIPFVAFAAAGCVQGGAFLLTRMRQRRWAEQDRIAALEAAGTPKPRTNGGRPRSQSTRTRA